MFFTKFLIATTLAAFALAHTVIVATEADVPKIQRSDAARPKDLDSCPDFNGPASVAKVAADGTVTLFAESFNQGKDGSLFFNAAMSLTGQKGSFQNALEIVQNGPEAPTTAPSQATIVVRIPGGMPCDNGTCVLAFQTKGGFGNCVRLQSDGVTPDSPIASVDSPASSTVSSSATVTATATVGGNKAQATCRPRVSPKVKREHPRDFMGEDMFRRRAH